MSFWSRPRAPNVPKGSRVYAIGDIHGCSHLLDALLTSIAADGATRPKARTRLLFLGDYVDRGPDSAGTIERLATLKGPFDAYFLLGNHEEVLLRLLEGEEWLLADWLRFGGAACVESYGIDAKAFAAMNAPDAIAALKAAIPAHHQAFLRACHDSISIGDYVFVHAGIRPGVALDRQQQKDMRWIRQPFLDSEMDHGQIVVHGHSIVPEVEMRSNRIAVDTGAYSRGVLSAIGLEGEERWVVSAGSIVDEGASQ